ncbi:MAG: Uma2 family endonuclease [Desulfurispora sp.]|uniref:Uma2 family endonuclease n=1 Tax=Desulfurispora sp. TaxID=3014275 RepID=UPI00404A0AC3
MMYTSQEYFCLPEGAPYQLIGGELVMTPAPGKKHQLALKRLLRLLDDYVEHHQAGEVLCAPRDVVLAENEVYQPDIVFVARERLGISQEDRVYGAPDLVVEVLSPSSAYYDLRKKFRAYEKYGVKEYWVVDPEERSIEVYVRQETGLVRVSRAEWGESIASVAVLSGFVCDVKFVFPWGEEDTK